MDENPIKVDSQILSVHVEPELPQPIKTPVSFTFANDDVSLFFCLFFFFIFFIFLIEHIYYIALYLCCTLMGSLEVLNVEVFLMN